MSNLWMLLYFTQAVLLKFRICDIIHTSTLSRDPDDPYKLTEDTRHLGLVVCRGTAVVLVCPVDGMEAIPNPFVQQE